MDVSVPTPEELEALFNDAEARDAFFLEHWEEYLDKYPEQFVVVHNGRVIAASADLRKLVAAVKAKGLELRDTWMKFVTRDEVPLIL